MYGDFASSEHGRDDSLSTIGEMDSLLVAVPFSIRSLTESRRWRRGPLASVIRSEIMLAVLRFAGLQKRLSIESSVITGLAKNLSCWSVAPTKGRFTILQALS